MSTGNGHNWAWPSVCEFDRIGATIGEHGVVFNMLLPTLSMITALPPLNIIIIIMIIVLCANGMLAPPYYPALFTKRPEAIITPPPSPHCPTFGKCSPTSLGRRRPKFCRFRDEFGRCRSNLTRIWPMST